MNFETLQKLSESNNWWGIWPEISLAILALILLVVELLMKPGNKRLIPTISLAAQCGLLIGILYSMFQFVDIMDSLNFAGLIKHSSLGQIMRVFFLVCSIMVTYMGQLYLKKSHVHRQEFYYMVLIVVAALMLVVQSYNFIMLFIALETFTIGTAVLVSFCRKSEFSLEAGLKFLILGALSSALLLFGIVFLYGAASNPMLINSTQDAMNYSELSSFIAMNYNYSHVQIGTLFILCGLAFKIGAVPFQIWIPDVYQGAPTPITALLAIASKAAGFIVLINLIQGPLAAMNYMILPILTTVAIISLLFGNITASSQHNIKRLMGLSGVAHAGYLLIGVITLSYVSWALHAIIFYLFSYLLGSFAVFVVMAIHSGSADHDQEIEDYTQIAQSNPFMAAGLLVGLGSLAGIPPLVGFVGKLLLFIAAIQAELYTLVGVAILGVVISIYYYFGWLREAFFRSWTLDEKPSITPTSIVTLSGTQRGILIIFCILILIAGVFQNFLMGLL